MNNDDWLNPLNPDVIERRRQRQAEEQFRAASITKQNEANKIAEEANKISKEANKRSKCANKISISAIIFSSVISLGSLVISLIALLKG